MRWWGFFAVMNDFIEKLKSRLADELPGETAQFRMAPGSRKRTSGTLWESVGPQQSAVLLYLFPHLGDWRIVLMKRTQYDGAHSGQVSIPGGRLEPGEDHMQAALREFEEETGVCVDRRQLLGNLSELFIPTSNFLVNPFVAYTDERPRFDPDPLEVEQLIEMQVPRLISDGSVKRGSVPLGNGVRVDTPYFDVQGHVVWGATAMILSELKEVLRDVH